MKKFLLALIVLFTAGCSVGYEAVSYENIESSIDNDETFVLVIGSASCSGCTSYKPEIDEIGKKHDITIKYVDIEKITDAELSRLSSKFVTTATPTTIFIEDGEETSTYDRIVGAISASELEDVLIDIGFIEE